VVGLENRITTDFHMASQLPSMPGSATCQTFANCKKNVIARAKVRLLEFLSAADPRFSRGERQIAIPLTALPRTPENLDAEPGLSWRFDSKKNAKTPVVNQSSLEMHWAG